MLVAGDGPATSAAMPFIETTSPKRHGHAAQQALAVAIVGLERRGMPILAADAGLTDVEEDTPSESMVGSGKFGTPWERMHWAYCRPAVNICCTNACGQSPYDSHCWACCRNDRLLGSRCWQARWAAWYWELLTPSCCGFPAVFETAPLLSGSGKFGTPWERMQPE